MLSLVEKYWVLEKDRKKLLGVNLSLLLFSIVEVTGCDYYPFWNLSYARQWNDENKPLIFFTT